MLRRRLVSLLILLSAVLGLSGVLYAQMEAGERGIAPIDSSGTLEVTGIHVDVMGKDGQSARYEGWRIAQRQGFRAYWAKAHNRPATEAPTVPDSTLDELVSSIVVEREQIGPNRYIADLGILFDRARSAEILGVGGDVRRSAPMILVPVLVTAGSETSVELRNPWQRAWAEFRTSQSPIDYVRVTGSGIDPLLVNAAQTDRPGRGWWRNIIDLYGAADVLVAEVQLQRLYPGGPAKATFIARHGPDNEVVGGFTLKIQNGSALPALMAEGVRRMDELFSTALAAGRLQRDSSLDLPAPPPLPVEEKPIETKPASTGNQYQIQIDAAGDVNVYNFGMAHLRTMGGITSATPQLINPTGTSYVLVAYSGSIGQLAAALSGRGWTVEASGTVIKIRSSSGKPPPLPPPPAPKPAPPQPTPPQAPPKPQGAGR